MRALIADDDVLSRRLLRGCLQPWGYAVTEVSDGEAAWDLLRQAEDTPWCALVSWHLPRLSGPDLCDRLRGLPHDPLVYVILLTGCVSPQDLVAGLQAGAHDYLSKPVDPAALYARLQVGARVLGLVQRQARQLRELAEALARAKALQGLLPMCSYCKSVRTDEASWQEVEHYLAAHTQVQFSHGICPGCYQKFVRPQLAAASRPRQERAEVAPTETDISEVGGG